MANFQDPGHIQDPMKSAGTYLPDGRVLEKGGSPKTSTGAPAPTAPVWNGIELAVPPPSLGAKDEAREAEVKKTESPAPPVDSAPPQERPHLLPPTTGPQWNGIDLIPPLPPLDKEGTMITAPAPPVWNGVGLPPSTTTLGVPSPSQLISDGTLTTAEGGNGDVNAPPSPSPSPSSTAPSTAPVMGNRAGDAPTYSGLTSATAPGYQAQGTAMQTAAQKSYGSSAADALAKAMKSGQSYAQDQAGRASANAGRESVGYARAAGMSPAQAAILAGQQSGNRYNDAYSANLKDAVGQYGTLASQIGSLGIAQGEQGLQKYGQDISKYGTQLQGDLTKSGQDLSKWQALLGADTTKYGQDIAKYSTDVGSATQRYATDKGVGVQQQQSNDNFWGSLLSAGAGIVGSLLSDKNAKEDIRDGYGILAKVTKEVGPKVFRYKAGVGENPEAEQVGVMAQDLEKTPLAGVVKTGEDGLKRVDTSKLTMGNTAMISELSKKLDTVTKYLSEAV